MFALFKNFFELLNRYICIVLIPKHVVIQNNQTTLSSLEILKLKILSEIGPQLSFYSCILSLNNIS